VVVVARRPLGEHPALAPCPTAPQCCACCTQRSSARTASWPADLHLFPRLLSAHTHTQVQVQIKQKHCHAYHSLTLTFICSESETANRRFMNAFMAKTTSSPAVLVSSCNSFPLSASHCQPPAQVSSNPLLSS
jgi:hypothetical protein